MIPLVIASRNEKKVREIRDILQGLPFELLSIRDFPHAPEPEENGRTFEENAVIKACAAARASGHISLADDSGLCVEALEGAPGVFSARFAGKEQDDLANCLKLLSLMQALPEEKRAAFFQCVVAICHPKEGVLGVTRGEYHGSVACDMRGSHGFGYDPVFLDPITGKRFAELEPAVKDRISHRAKALERARQILARYDAKVTGSKY
jgi:XTP/dITP diphosphohydrolase